MSSSELGPDLDSQSVALAVPARPSHSRAGIASTVAGVLGLAHVVGFVVAGVSLSGHGTSADVPSAVTWGAVLMSGWGLACLAIGLGVGALDHPARRRLFSIIGIAAGVLAVLAWAAIVLLGMILNGYF